MSNPTPGRNPKNLAYKVPSLNGCIPNSTVGAETQWLRHLLLKPKMLLAPNC
uniref:Uncharacterized protein n=1 Tax=Manihot esculenta TaxID=3983 RepID=A0A2C9UI79_MANES